MRETSNKGKIWGLEKSLRGIIDANGTRGEKLAICVWHVTWSNASNQTPPSCSSRSGDSVVRKTRILSFWKFLSQCCVAAFCLSTLLTFLLIFQYNSLTKFTEKHLFVRGCRQSFGHRSFCQKINQFSWILSTNWLKMYLQFHRRLSPHSSWNNTKKIAWKFTKNNAWSLNKLSLFEVMSLTVKSFCRPSLPGTPGIFELSGRLKENPEENPLLEIFPANFYFSHKPTNLLGDFFLRIFISRC